MKKLNELKNTKLDNKGFSLVELIIVIAIMAVLIGVLAPQYLKYVERSRESADLASINTIIHAVEIYNSDPATTKPATGNIKCGGTGALTIDPTIQQAMKDSGLPDSVSMKSAEYKKTGWKITFAADGWTVTENNPSAPKLGPALGR